MAVVKTLYVTLDRKFRVVAVNSPGCGRGYTVQRKQGRSWEDGNDWCRHLAGAADLADTMYQQRRDAMPRWCGNAAQQRYLRLRSEASRG